MPSLEAVTPHRHAGQYWHPSPNYRFAAHDPMATLVVAEMPEACLHLPLGFSRVGDVFVPVALQGLRTQQNLWVDAEGHWRGGYIPAVYRSHPFTLARADERRILCVDRDSGLIDDDNSGQPFFDAEQQPAEQIRQVTEFLRQVNASAEATKPQCAALDAQALIQPWPLQISDGEQTQTLQGLYRIDEEALNALSSGAFDTLRQAGVLPMIYCQLLSMRHVNQLAARARADNQASQPAEAGGKDPDSVMAEGDHLDLEFLKHNTIRFN